LILLKSKILRIEKKTLDFLILIGFALACFNIAWTLGVTFSGAVIATVLVYSSAGFTALLGYFFLQESLGWKKAASLILCLFGCVLVSRTIDLEAWQRNALGIISVIFSG
jgi:drug/metabolite transporter (DMT)-like permease